MTLCCIHSSCNVCDVYLKRSNVTVEEAQLFTIIARRDDFGIKCYFQIF